MATVVPKFLFGTYFLELVRFFRNFKTYRLQDDDVTPIPTQVIYGTPQAAFRKIFVRFNGQMVLPVLNFYAVEFERKTEKEPLLYPTGTYTVRNYVNTENKTLLKTRPPAQFDIQYQFNLFTKSQKERDHMLMNIIRAFPRNELSLIHFPDPTDKTNFLLMPLKIEPNYSDETDVEGLEEKEVRDIIRTTFLMKGEALVPMEYKEVPYIEFVAYFSKVDQTLDLTYEYIKYITSSNFLEDPANMVIEIESGGIITL